MCHVVDLRKSGIRPYARFSQHQYTYTTSQYTCMYWYWEVGYTWTALVYTYVQVLPVCTGQSVLYTGMPLYRLAARHLLLGQSRRVRRMVIVGDSTYGSRYSQKRPLLVGGASISLGPARYTG